MKRSRKESELNTVDSQIRGLETRLKYSKTDREKTVSSRCLSYYLKCNPVKKKKRLKHDSFINGLILLKRITSP